MNFISILLIYIVATMLKALLDCIRWKYFQLGEVALIITTIAMAPIAYLIKTIRFILIFIGETFFYLLSKIGVM
jgi:hypothetical protein